MIKDLDYTIKQLLSQNLPTNLPIEKNSIDINFDMPDRDWVAKLQKLPTINLFLYDFRENRELRNNERLRARTGTTALEIKSPVYMDFSYMITVWASDINDEHQVLGAILKTLLRYPVLPMEVLQGELQTELNHTPLPDRIPLPGMQPIPLRAWVSQPERIPNSWEFWTVLEGRLKAGISYVVTVPVQPFTPDNVYLATENTIKFNYKGSSSDTDANQTTNFHIATDRQ